MSASSSLSIIAVSSPASTSSSQHLFSITNLRFPFRLTLPNKSSKLINSLNLHTFPPFSRVPRPYFCASSTGFDGIGSGELLEEENLPLEEENEDEKDATAEEGNENRVASQPADTGRLYVGNLPFSLTSSQLAEIFSEAGRVVSVEVVYDKVAARSRGFAFLTMASVEEANEAIRLFDGAEVSGRTVKVNFPEVPRGGEREVMASEIRNSIQSFVDTPHKIYAGNLSWGITSQGLKETFQSQPGFLSAKVIYDRGTGRSRGFGFVTFTSAEEVQAALNTMNGVEVEGRPLRLNLAELNSRVSPPSKSETYSTTEAVTV